MLVANGKALDIYFSVHVLLWIKLWSTFQQSSAKSKMLDSLIDIPIAFKAVAVTGHHILKDPTIKLISTYYIYLLQHHVHI